MPCRAAGARAAEIMVEAEVVGELRNVVVLFR